MKIVAHSYISAKGAYLNGVKQIAYPDDDLRYLRHIYKELKLDYPKFYKMDNLSKSAILANHLLTPFYGGIHVREDNLQMIFANREASKKTDLSFIDSYEIKENASPSLFVYTLPNIVTGELAIKNKWYGENTFFILETFDAPFYEEQLTLAFNRGNEHALCAWIQEDENGKEECFLFLITNSTENKVSFELENIINTYRNE